MTVHGIDRDEQKKPLEHVVCFGVAVAALMAAAFAAQWLINFVVP